MTTLSFIAEPYPDWEAPLHRAAARDLARALAEMAPRTCAERVLIARDSEEIEVTNPRMRVERIGLRAARLPLAWQAGTTARPLDGELVHSITPLAPLRRRNADDGSQTTVLVPHLLPWLVPETGWWSTSRTYRTYVRRAARLADVVLVPSYAVADQIHEHVGAVAEVVVSPLAAPSEIVLGAANASLREYIGLPEHYLVTFAAPGALGRREWITQALRENPWLPPVVCIEGFDPLAPGTTVEGSAPPGSITTDLEGRLISLHTESLGEVGSILAGASMLLQPQVAIGSGYLTLSALALGIPVLHSGDAVSRELVLDAGEAAETSEQFSSTLSLLSQDPNRLEQLGVLAADRGRGMTWQGVAWQIWETHASI